jgi:uncharacterized circularly permuted ATP-grasp superfamily protein
MLTISVSAHSINQTSRNGRSCSTASSPTSTAPASPCAPGCCRSPSGAGYALANRRIVSRVLAAVRRHAQIRRLGPFFDAMRRGLEELAPATDRARVVLLTPGPRSETAYEQALLASRLGFPQLLASELTVREGRVRRVDAAWCDPLDLRQDSHLGVPGLLEAARPPTSSWRTGGTTRTCRR